MASNNIVHFFFLNAATQSDDFFKNYAPTEIFGAPAIIPSDPDITLQPGTNFSIRCESKDPIIWKPFEVSALVHRYYAIVLIIPFLYAQAKVPTTKMLQQKKANFLTAYSVDFVW